MEEFELLLGLLLLAVILAGAARRIGVPYPAFLALGGVALALIPGTPRFVMSPDLALAVFVAPVLLDAAYDSSPRDLRENWAPLAGLVVAAVGLTTAAVAWVARSLEPAMPWAVAVALGAVVAPPDAAAATAVLKQVRPPHRIVTILEGESLLNDATALLVFRVAIGALDSHGFSLVSVGPTFLLAVVGSLIAGPIIARLFLHVTKDVRDIPSTIILQFLGCFGLWVLAEKLHLSAVLTSVSFAISIARTASERTPGRMRIPSYAVWDTVVFVANVLAFFLIGLQIRPVLEGLEGSVRERYFIVAGAVLVTVVVVRIAWVLLFNAAVGLRCSGGGGHHGETDPHANLKGGVIVSWCGMRGIVTLAAALALPAEIDGQPFPFRGLVVLTAFSVVLGTLVVQGLTLKPLLRFLDLRDDDPVGKEVNLARTRALQAVLSSIDGDTSLGAELVREQYGTLLRASDDRANGDEDVTPATVTTDELRRRALAAARHVVSELRSNKEIGDDAYHRIEEDLDRLELGIASE